MDMLAFILGKKSGGGGGGGGSAKHGVFFLDYDGSIVESWATDTVAAKTALPSNPTHTGLVAQGWNWGLQHIKDNIAAYENADVYVGQMYKTSSGLTEMDITVTKVTGLTVTCNMVGNKNWGDGTTDNLTTHTYANYGDYTITCDGTRIPAGSSSASGLFGASSSNMNRYWCTAIRIGENVTSIGNYTFSNCGSLKSIIIPQGVTSIGSYVFIYCGSLTSITIPQGVTRIGNNALQSCYSLKSITIPQGVTSIEGYVLNNCHSLTSIVIPQGVTSIGNYAFNSCHSLTSIVIPQGVTSIGSYAFNSCYALTSITIPQGVTRIANNAFQRCLSFTSIAIPAGVTSVEGYAFGNCDPITIYDFTSATGVPTMSNVSAFSNINGICKIIVPDALYDTWIAATNWATYADYIYKASEVAA